MRTLYVQKIDRKELCEKWRVVGKFLPLGELFIRSNKKGVVNFDKAPVYSWTEILNEQERRRVVFTIPKEVFEL